MSTQERPEQPQFDLGTFKDVPDKRTGHVVCRVSEKGWLQIPQPRRGGKPALVNIYEHLPPKS